MKKIFKSLTFKIGVIIILVEIVVLAVTGFFYITRFRNEIDTRIKTKIEIPGTLVSKGLLNFSSIADRDVMVELVGEGLTDAIVVGADDSVFHSLDPTYVGGKITQVPGINLDWFNENLPDTLLAETSDGLVSITPIRTFAEEKSSFFVYVKVGAEETAREKQTILFLFLGGSLISIVLTSIAIILLFNTAILSRVREVLDVLTAVEQGNLAARTSDTTAEDEIGILQQGVNSMAAQLEGIVGELEERITGRTQRLETVAALGERLSAILNLDELLLAMVNQIKESFGYYHAHVYMLDEAGNNLVVAEGTGQAGAQMKARGHSIPLRAPTSLVARAARTSRIVRVDNVREAADWLPNPLLPNTYAELAVPIILEGDVVGVLDVQEDKVGGLDEGDANLLRSVASQVAVNLNNARLFEQTQAALAETEMIHRRYMAQAWEAFRESQSALQAEKQKSKALTVGTETLSLIKQQVVQQGETVAIHSQDSQEEENGNRRQATIVTPLKLRGQVIGTLGLLDVEADRYWTDEEITLIEAISEQATLALENARLFEETQQRAAREKVIADITGQVWTSNELEKVMQTAVEQLGLTLDASKVIIRLGTEDQLLD